MEPLVSVIMPSYNAEHYIGEAIESVLCQTYKNWELLAIEDCSSDHTLDVIRSYQDERIRVFCNSENLGIADSTNRGILESRGKYIALLDDDDIAEKDRLMLQVAYLEQHPQADILGGRTTLIDEKGNVVERLKEPRNNPKYIKAVLLFSCMDFMNSTAMIRKEFILHNNLYYRNGCYGMQDYRFYMESSKIGTITTINEFLLRHRIHNNNETEKNLRDHKKERAEVYAQFQRYSLWKSGYRLREEALDFINRMLAERGGGCSSKSELKQLYEIFKELLRQGKQMDIDYYQELQHVCKMKLSEQLAKIEDLFE